MPQVIQILSPSGIKWKGWAQNKLKALKKIIAHPFNLTYPLPDATVQLIFDGQNDIIRITGGRFFYIILYAGEATVDYSRKLGYLVVGDILYEDNQILNTILDIGLYGISALGNPDNPFTHYYMFNKETGFIPYSPTLGLDTKDIIINPQRHILHNTMELNSFNFQERGLGSVRVLVLCSFTSLFFNLLSVNRPQTDFCVFKGNKISLSYHRRKILFNRWIAADTVGSLSYWDTLHIHKYRYLVSKDSEGVHISFHETSPLSELDPPYRHLTTGITSDGGHIKLRAHKRLYYKFDDIEEWGILTEPFYKETYKNNMSSEVSFIAQRSNDPNHWAYLLGHFGLRWGGWDNDSDTPTPYLDWDDRSFINYVAKPKSTVPLTGYKDTFVTIQFRLSPENNTYFYELYDGDTLIYSISDTYFTWNNNIYYPTMKILRKRLTVLHAIKDRFHTVVIFCVSSLRNINDISIQEFKDDAGNIYECQNLVLREFIEDIEYYAYIDGHIFKLTYGHRYDKKDLHTISREYLVKNDFKYRLKGSQDDYKDSWYFDFIGWSNLGYTYNGFSEPIRTDDTPEYPDRFFISTTLSGVLIVYDIYRVTYANKLALKKAEYSGYYYDYFTPYYDQVPPFTDKPESTPLIDRVFLLYAHGALISIRLPDNLLTKRAINGISLIERG